MRKVLIRLLITCLISTTHAGVTIDGTRIIFPAESTSVGVQVRNEFNIPALIQVWIDNGNIQDIPDAEDIPFVLTPPLSRVEPHQGQIVRIIPTETSKLPQDRESLFWFNLLDIPPENPNLAEKNILSFTVRTRIKLFYRPKQLKASFQESFKKLEFHYMPNERELEVRNPTPFYITISGLIFKTLDVEKNYKKKFMMMPFSNQKISDLNLDSKPTDVDYSVINDLGGVQSHSKKLN